MKPAPFLFGLSATLFSGVVYAAPSEGLSAEVFLFGAASILVTAFWFWVNSVSSRQKEQEKNLAQLRIDMLTQFHPKQDIAEMMIEVKASLKEIRDELRDNQRKWEQRFDKFENLYGR